MRDFRSVIHIIGLLLCIEAIAMTIPMFVDLIYKVRSSLCPHLVKICVLRYDIKK